LGLDASALQRRIPKHARLLLDTTTLIAYLNGTEDVSDVAAHVIDRFVGSERNAAAVSMITVMEVLVRPIQQNIPGFTHARDFLMRFPNLTAAPIDFAIATEAATLRAREKFRPPDALIIATGLVYQTGFLLTNDRSWQKKLHPINDRIEVVNLSDYVAR